MIISAIWVEKAAVNLKHLEARLQQSGHLDRALITTIFKEILIRKFQEVDIENAKMEIIPFLKDREKDTLEFMVQ